MTTTSLLRALLLSTAALGVSPAFAQNLVTNGGFETVYSSGTTPMTADSKWLSPGNLANWTGVGGLAFAYTPGSADNPNSAAATASAAYGKTYLAGPDSGFANGLSNASPLGGNFYAVDSNFVSGALQQTLNGLTVGQTYTLSFWYAAGQLVEGVAGTGTLSSGWTAAVTSTTGNGVPDVYQSFVSAAYGQGGFVPWTQVSATFVATGAQEVLTLWPTGTGNPPMSLLDGVAVMQGANVLPAVPESSSALLMLIGGALILRTLQRRRTRSA